MALDPVTLAILKGRLEQIADEMDATLFRSAFNPIIAEAHDASHGIYDAQSGDTLVQGKSVHPDRIHLPMTKNGRPFDLPILDLHHELLEPMRGLSREWVFPAPKSRAGHLECPKRIDWSLHAHRRTFATVAMEAGVLEEIVGRLLRA